MYLNISGRVRNYIFIVVLGVVLISLIVAFSVAAKQDKAFRSNYQLYQQANQLINKQQYTQAQDVLAQLDKDSSASYQVLYLQAICTSNTGDLAAAIDFMQKAREIRPALLMDQNFLLQYGLILYRSGEYEQAKLYLLESRKYNSSLEASKEADNYLAEIDRIEKAGGKG